MSDTAGQPLNPTVLKELIDEAARIEEDSIHSAKSQFECADRWSYRNLLIGIPTSTLAAVAGFAALKDHPKIAGFLALAVAASSAVFTFLNPRERSSTHLAAGNAYKALENDARIFRLIDCKNRPEDPALVDVAKSLNDRRNALNAKSPQHSRWAFNRARKGIKEGETKYAVDAGKPHQAP